MLFQKAIPSLEVKIRHSLRADSSQLTLLEEQPSLNQLYNYVQYIPAASQGTSTLV